MNKVKGIFFFFNLENSNKKKSCGRELLKSDGEETTDANVVLNEIYIFSGAPNENVVQNHLNIELLNVF